MIYLKNFLQSLCTQFPFKCIATNLNQFMCNDSILGSQSCRKKIRQKSSGMKIMSVFMHNRTRTQWDEEKGEREESVGGKREGEREVGGREGRNTKMKHEKVIKWTKLERESARESEWEGERKRQAAKWMCALKSERGSVSLNAQECMSESVCLRALACKVSL